MEDTIKLLEKTTFFSKSTINELNLYYLYINNDVVEAIEKENVSDKSKLSASFIQERFMQNKIYNNKAYTLNGLHKFNFEQDSVLDMLQSEDLMSNFTKYKKIEPILFLDTIYHFTDYASLFFILENKKKKVKTKKENTVLNKTKKSYSS